MKECLFEESLTFAEKSCQEALKQYLPEDVPVFRFQQPGRADCAVFAITTPQSGELFAGRPKSLHFRARLDIYRRDHDALQATVMHILANLPVNADLSADHVLREESNVIVFRATPDSGALSEIVQEPVATRNGEIVTCRCTITFDVVFAVRFD